jgi:ribonuclease E
VQFGRISIFGLLEMSRQRLRESSVQWNIVLTLDSFACKILNLAEEQAISNKIKNVNIKVSEVVSETIKKKFDEKLSYCKKKHKLLINFTDDNSLIIPEYKIELLNKNKKIVKSLEHKTKAIENLNYKKFSSKDNRKYLKKNLQRKKIKPYTKYRNKYKKENNRNFNMKPKVENRNLN